MNMNSGVKIALVVLLSSWGTLVLAEDHAAPALDEARFFKVVSAARDLAQLPAETPPAARMEALKRFEELAPVATEPGGPVFAYVRYRTLLLAGNAPEAQKGFVKLAGTCSVAPEAVVGLLETNKDEPKRSIALQGCMADLEPIGRWQKWPDNRHGIFRRAIQPSPPSIPLHMDKQNLIWIARLFEAAGQYDHAWRAWAEVVYAALPSSFTWNDRHWESWLSTHTAYLWMHVAENAWKAGEKSSALDYLAKFVIFGPENHLAIAKASLTIWKAREGDKSDEVSPGERVDPMRRIVTIYVSLNVHPRALELIRRYPRWLNERDCTELQKEYLAEWTDVLKAFSAGYRPVDEPGRTLAGVVYGVELTDNTDPASIKVPFFCPPEALEQVQKRVNDLYK